MSARIATAEPLNLASAIIREPLVVSVETTAIDAIAQMSGVRAICDARQPDGSQLDRILHEARSSCVLVVDGDRLAGILTERDVVRLSAE
ncbi:MAG: CBS domain-containing protein, partial [Cyanobacteria bacterium J06639_1]